ncbi:MAG TPA: hypothetical protein VLB73_03170 [Patescibacteria group bacterium]|nr:hypothetical protein [Patescibacteria group bacterium]
MITVPEAAKEIIERSRYLTEAMSKDLINYSSLARYIKPEVEKMLMKKISDASLIMAIKRIAEEIKPKFVPLTIFTSAPEMIVRSNLIDITVANSPTLAKKVSKIIDLHHANQKYFFTLTEGLSETTIIASKDAKDIIEENVKGETILARFENLSAITIRQPKEISYSPGVVYFFLKSLAWEGINLIEVVSTYVELTLILEDKDVNTAFGILKGLFPVES